DSLLEADASRQRQRSLEVRCRALELARVERARTEVDKRRGSLCDIPPALALGRRRRAQLGPERGISRKPLDEAEVVAGRRDPGRIAQPLPQGEAAAVQPARVVVASLLTRDRTQALHRYGGGRRVLALVDQLERVLEVCHRRLVLALQECDLAEPYQQL